MSQIPREARDGLMRAWLAILKDRHPDVTWIAQEAKAVAEPVTGAADQVEPVAA
jgi:hypothetical protein